MVHDYAFKKRPDKSGGQDNSCPCLQGFFFLGEWYDSCRVPGLRAPTLHPAVVEECQEYDCGRGPDVLE